MFQQLPGQGVVDALESQNETGLMNDVFRQLYSLGYISLGAYSAVQPWTLNKGQTKVG